MGSPINTRAQAKTPEPFALADCHRATTARDFTVHGDGAWKPGSLSPGAGGRSAEVSSRPIWPSCMSLKVRSGLRKNGAGRGSVDGRCVPRLKRDGAKPNSAFRHSYNLRGLAAAAPTTLSLTDRISEVSMSGGTRCRSCFPWLCMRVMDCC